MAKLVYALNMSLDGYVNHDHPAFAPPGPELFRHFIEEVRNTTGSLYGRRMYETMRYWDTDDAGWNDDLREYAQVWRAMPKWVVSSTLKEVGPNATLVEGDIGAAARRLKEEHEGQIEVAGPELAGSLTELGLIDVYQLYMRPVVLGGGKPFFVGPRPALRLVANEVISDDAIRLSYMPA